MNKPPAFQFYPDDFIGGTVAMSTEDVGSYIRLLCYQWGTGKIPNDETALCRIAGCKVSEDVKLKFPHGKNPRLERERKKQQEYRENRSVSGKAGAEKRWHSHSIAISTATVLPMAKNSSPSPSPSPIKEVPAVTAGGEHKAFIDGWCSNFKDVLNCEYKFDGGRDGKAVKELLSMGILRLDLLELAKKAWRLGSFNGRQSQTIHGFRQYFNPIQVEIKNGNHQTTKPNPRNFGVTIGPTNYGTAKPRLQRECEEKERLAKQMAAAENNPPAT